LAQPQPKLAGHVKLHLAQQHLLEAQQNPVQVDVLSF
jgi:hypothetical protein